MYNSHRRFRHLVVKCQTHMFRKIIILYYNIRIVVTGVVKCQTNIIIYNYMACIAFVGSLSAHLITRRRHARALRHLANITAIKDGGLYRWTMVHLLRGQIALKVDTQRNMGILRRSRNYLCFVHVCKQRGCDRSTIVRRRSLNIGSDRG